MSNTRETLGEQATLDGLITRTLTTLEEDNITILAPYALYMNTGLTSVNFPSLISLGDYSLKGCSNLTTVDIGGICNFEKASFSSCSKVDTLILRNTDRISNLKDIDVLRDTKIALGFGGVYVPNTLLSTYKSNYYWGNIKNNIFPLDEYPKTTFDTINDSWSTIIANCDAKTIDNYNIGDTKQLTFNDTNVLMEIVAKNTDKLADSSDTASLTWLCKEVYLIHSMSNNNTNGWISTNMRTWLHGNEVLGSFPTELQNGIKEVKKPWYDSTSNTTKTSNDKIWIPSTYEMFSDYPNKSEETGDDNVQYTKFNSDRNRQKHYRGSIIHYWLRSGSSSYTSVFCMIYDSGNLSGSSPSNTQGVAFGFCT